MIKLRLYPARLSQVEPSFDLFINGVKMRNVSHVDYLRNQHDDKVVVEFTLPKGEVEEELVWE